MHRFRYRPAYKAFRSDSSFNFMIFFMIFFFQFIALVYQTVGLHGSGYCGFVTAIAQFDGTVSGVLFGLLTLVVAISFGVCAFGSFLLLTKVNTIIQLNCTDEVTAVHVHRAIHTARLSVTSFGSLLIDNIVSFRI